MSEKTIEAIAKLGAVGVLGMIVWRMLDILSRQTAALEQIARTYTGG